MVEGYLDQGGRKDQRNQMIKLKCQCCGFEQEFADDEAVFDAGWDAPPLFPYVSCDLCPGVCIILGAGHTLAHAIWEREGRPKSFSVEKCATDDVIGEPERMKAALENMARLRELMDTIRKSVK